MRIIGLALLLTLGVLASRCAAAEPGGGPVGSSAGSDGLGELVTALVLKAAPHNYENTRQWGGTRRVWDGLHIQADGLRIKTKRRWKDANHGTWKRYRVWLADPDRRFDIRFRNLHRTDSGAAAFDLVVRAELGAFGRLSEWRRDVQLFSFSANAEADVRLVLKCEMTARLETDRLPPDVLLDLSVRDAELTLVDFRLHRISDAGGPLVKQLGEALEKVLEDEIADRRGKLVDRLNREIADHQDDLRLSTAGLARSGWKEVVELLPLGGVGS